MFLHHDRQNFLGARYKSLFTKRVLDCCMLLTGAAAFILLSKVSVAASIPCADNPGALCYGDFMGNTVMYLNVREEATTVGDEEPLFGEPTISGDSLDFDPIGFDASATNGSSDITDSNLSFTVMAKPLHVIKNLTLSEAGDTTLIGLAPANAYSSVTAAVFVDILEVDGAGVALPGSNFSMLFTPSDGDYDLITDGGGGPRYHTIWTGSLLVDVMGILDAAVANGDIPPYNVGATKISINMDNTLTALSEVGTFAVIAKKDAGGISITVNIPEPTSLALAGLCLLAFGLARRSGR